MGFYEISKSYLHFIQHVSLKKNRVIFKLYVKENIKNILSCISWATKPQNQWNASAVEIICQYFVLLSDKVGCFHLRVRF